MMIKFYALISLLCCIDLASSDVTSCCKSNKQAFDFVNDYLVKNGTNKDPKRDLELAIEWLEEKSPHGFLSKSPYEGVKNQLEILRDLPSICDSESHLIIKKNYRATGGWIDELERERTKGKENSVALSRPINRIVQFYIAQNAKNCLPKYQNDLKNEYIRIGFENSPVKKLALGWINGKFLKASGQEDYMSWNLTSQDRLRDDIVKHSASRVNFWELIEPTTVGKPMGAIVFEALKHFTIGNELTSASKLYADYIINPCKNYIDELKYSSLKSSLVEDNLLIRIALKSKEDFLKLLDYNIGLAGYELCENILSNNRNTFSFMHRLVREKARDSGESVSVKTDKPLMALIMALGLVGLMG